MQILVNTPELEKKAVLQAILRSLRETCGLFRSSSFAAFQEVAKNAQQILDGIVAPSRSDTPPEEKVVEKGLDAEAVEGEEFIESAAFGATSSEVEQIEEISEDMERAETFVTTVMSQQKPGTSQEGGGGSSGKADKTDNSSQGRMDRLIAKWNGSSAAWLKFPSVTLADSRSSLACILASAGTRTNLLSNNFEGQTEILKKFDDVWQQMTALFQDAGYQITPSNFASSSPDDSGKLVYTCRSRTTSDSEKELIAPAVEFQGKSLRDSVWAVVVPADSEFPSDQSHGNFPSHWRGILGELHILLEHLEIQPKAMSAVEGINKNRVEPLDDCRANIIAELKRREDVLLGTLQKGEETSYRLATDYWRIEEFFWSVFHDDDRPPGCSYFDRMRARLQGWRTTLRRILKLFIRDFACGSDSLASVNQYIGNIILQPQKNMPPGVVIRELRPAIMVKDQATNRLLKGRVIAT